MDINKAKENLKGYLNWLKTTGFSMAKNDKAIQTILSELDKDNNIISDLQNEVTLKQSELDKKDKIINDMAKEIHINNIFDCDYKHFLDNKCRLEYPDVPNEYKCKQCIIDYFTNKYEEGKGQ